MNSDLLYIFLFFISIVLLSLAVCAIARFVYYVKDKVFKKKYPEWIAFVNDYNAKVSEHCAWYNENIPPIKRKIDNLEKSKEYLPKSEREKIDLEIEELKDMYFRLKQEDDIKNKEIRDIWTITGKEIAEKENYKGYS